MASQRTERAQVTGRVAGKVALVTGAARGQGRSHAVRLAVEGADIIAVDICRDYESLDYELASEADLAETADAVRAAGRRIVTARADVRDAEELGLAIDAGVAELGRLDVVCANAGVCSQQAWDQVTPRIWQDVIDTNLTGVWNTIVRSVPHLLSGGGGSIICTGSTGGVKGLPFLAPYVAAKHGLVGLAKSMANELAAGGIRVNVVHPTGVDTPMVRGLDHLPALIATQPHLGPIFTNALPLRLIEAADVSNAVLFLASDESRYVTGLELTVDAGSSIR